MDASLFGQLFVNGLVLGLIYCLVASGLVLVIGIVDIFNFAHGEFYMIGAFVAYGIYSLLQMNFVFPKTIRARS